MIDITLFSQISKSSKKLSDSEENSDDDLTTTQMVMFTVFIILYFIIVFWSIARAIKCSSPSPDSRALHLLFCFISPGLYLVSSLVVPGFCPE